MRKTSAVLASLSLAAIALTGCSASATFAGAACDRTSHANGIENAVTVTGELGEAPDVTIYSPVENAESAYTDVIVGDGAPVVDDQQVMQLQMSIYSGSTGEQVFATTYESGTGSLSNIANWAAESPGMADVFECITGGSRVVASLTPEDFGAASASSVGLGADDRAIVVIDVLQTYLSKAEGALQFNDARGLPTVVRAPDGTPGVIIPDADAPTELVRQTLIKGDGAEVDETQALILNVTAVGWDDKKVQNTSWGTTPILDLQSTAPTVAEALVGETVGSQVLVVTPAADGASATAYVVDILGAVTTPEQ